MISKDTLTGVFAGVGSTAGLLIGEEKKLSHSGRLLLGLVGGVAGGILGELLCRLTHPEKKKEQAPPPVNP